LNKENNEKIKLNICSIEDCGRLTHKQSKYCIFHAKPDEKTEDEFKNALKEYAYEIKKENKDHNFSFFIFVGKIAFIKDLNITTFTNANFEGATFEDNANFERTTFEGRANFENAGFEGNVYFDQVIFKVNSNFLGSTFKGDISFSETTLVPATWLEIKLLKKGIIKFEKTNLEGVILDLDLVNGVLIDFTNALLMNTKINKEQISNHILQEERKEFSQAREVYLILKNNFRSIGRYNEEGWAFTKEKDMDRKSNFHFKSLHKWLWSCFLNVIYGYGEKPGRVMALAMMIIIVFTFIFMSYGLIDEIKSDTLPKYNILNELFMGIKDGDLLVRLKNMSLDQVEDCLYFSTVTFTTLGIGDFVPIEGSARILVGTEAFIGAFVMALFVYTFAKSTGGR